ncbi:restriction endonuclease subunit S [Limosilactobacillus caviae]|uniref:restriction endonuclease subunit S n=1 Tax=Limosilactobacillus caviae TaxID=1769424 RepID=UPI0035145DA4
MLEIENNLSGSDPPNLSSKDLYQINIKIPSESNEQKQIGTFLTKLDNLISLQQRKLEQLKQLKKTMLQQLFVQNKSETMPEVRFNNFNSEWQIKSLNELQTSVYSGIAGKTKDDFGHGEARYITYLNIHDNVVAKTSGVDRIERDLRQHKVEKGDLLFTISSEIPEEVALNSVWPGDNGKDLYLNSFCFGYRPMQNKVNPFFLSYYLRTPFLRKNIFPLAQGISRFNISKKSILDLSIALPQLKEQNDIYELLAKIDKIITQKNNNISQLKILKIQKLFV